ncbi:hypothetical protein BH11BAC2_BH11BAC2_21300 [soil metagenome]
MLNSNDLATSGNWGQFKGELKNIPPPYLPEVYLRTR